MTVTPFRKQQFQTRRDLYQLVSSCQHLFWKSKQTQILSFSVEINSVDPLSVLHHLAKERQISCYFEKHDQNGEPHSEQKGIAIAAIGAALQASFAGGDRFQAAKQFTKQALANIHLAGANHLPLAGPHFFCGFRFFSNSEDLGFKTTIFLPNWQVSTQSKRSVFVANLVINASFNIEKSVESLWQTLQKVNAIPDQLIKPWGSRKSFLQQSDVTDTAHFKQAVTKVLQSIQAGQIAKVVLAHAVDVRSPLPFQPSVCLQNLRRLYPDCYLFALNNGAEQVFLGASPERLVSLQTGHLLTDALAGSAPRGTTPYEDAQLANTLLNSPKELHEHEVVRDFITHQLQGLGLAAMRSPLRLRQLPNIQHLHTPIHATVPAGVHLLDIVSQLHPTPAVAGLPRAAACAQIRQHEGFERDLYAAPIGWLDHHGNGEFAVGIRSALITGCHARLFAGAGIVAGSDPDQELAEVQLKLQALLKGLS